MSKTALIKTELVSVETTVGLETRRDRILNYHQSVIRAFGQQMGYAFLCGLELNAAKEEIAHGQFEKWREQFLPDLPRSTANNYRNFATLLQEKSKTLARLTDRAQNLLTNGGEFADTDRTEILQAVHDVADGKTLTDLYRALGVVRDKVHQKDRDNGRKLTREERETERKDNALDWARQIIARLEEYCADNDSAHQLHDDLPDAIIQELQDAILSASRINKALLKARRVTRAKLGHAAKKKAKK